jgi:hypothetical protein
MRLGLILSAKVALGACVFLVCLLLLASHAQAGCGGRAGFFARAKERAAERREARSGAAAHAAGQSCGCSVGCTCGDACPAVSVPAAGAGFVNEARVHTGPVPQVMPACPGGVCPNPASVLPRRR